MDENEISFGQKLRALREGAGLSVRELAKAIKVSAPFLSDVELGRRFPKEETLQVLANHLRIPTDVLKSYDHRTAVADLKRIADDTPSLGASIRLLVNQINSGAMPASELATKLRALCDKSAKTL